MRMLAAFPTFLPAHVWAVAQLAALSHPSIRVFPLAILRSSSLSINVLWLSGAAARYSEPGALGNDGWEVRDGWREFTGSTPLNAERMKKERNMNQTMKPRMKHPVMVIPDAMQALLALGKSAEKGGVPTRTLDLIYLRASQINGCSVCVDMHARDAKKAGETDERLFAVAAWREAPYFTAAERAALALTEAVTRLADRPNPVPDEIWDEAGRHYDEKGLAALIIAIAGINVWNRLNATTRQIAGKYTSSAEAQAEVQSHLVAR